MCSRVAIALAECSGHGHGRFATGRGAVRAVRRLSPTSVQLMAAGLAAEPSNLTGWAPREFGDADAQASNYG